MAKQSKKNLLPKRIAGVKVPKSVRRGRIAEAIASPTGRVVLAELFMAAAAAAKQAKADATSGDALTEVTDRLRGAGEDVAKRAAKAGQATDETGGAVTYAMGEAARAFADALNRRRAEGGEKAQSGEGWTEPPEAVDSKKKPASFEGVPH